MGVPAYLLPCYSKMTFTPCLQSYSATTTLSEKVCTFAGTSSPFFHNIQICKSYHICLHRHYPKIHNGCGSHFSHRLWPPEVCGNIYRGPAWTPVYFSSSSSLLCSLKSDMAPSFLPFSDLLLCSHCYSLDSRMKGQLFSFCRGYMLCYLDPIQNGSGFFLTQMTRLHWVSWHLGLC